MIAVHTNREELERVRSFARQLEDREQHRRPASANMGRTETLPGGLVCDACGRPVDVDVEGLRFRHQDCPPPPRPPAAEAVFAKVETLRSKAAER